LKELQLIHLLRNREERGRLTGYKETHRPILLTSRGRGVAVVQGIEEYEKKEEEIAFMKAVAIGLMEVREGKEIELSEVINKLGIE